MWVPEYPFHAVKLEKYFMHMRVKKTVIWKRDGKFEKFWFFNDCQINYLLKTEVLLSLNCSFLKSNNLNVIGLKSWILPHKKGSFPLKYFFSKYDQIWRFLQIWSHLVKRFLIQNFIFYAMSIISADSASFNY